MGHERIGFLPKTREWKRITDQLSCFSEDSAEIKRISYDTLQAVRSTYSQLMNDESLIKCIQFLAAISVSAKKDSQVEYLKSIGFEIPGSGVSTYQLINNANRLIDTEHGSLETNKIAKDALTQAVIEYGKKEVGPRQISLFDSKQSNVWNSAGSGAAFCELARNFIASFTDRQLRYYLERTAADSINDYTRYNTFLGQLKDHTSEIGNHAFETSKLVQSFSAGWFNKHCKNGMPSEDAARDYLRISLTKMKEEFRREAEGT